jgi:hypothetical protein
MQVPCGKEDARKKKSEDARQELPIVEHTWPVGRVARFLGTSALTGLTDADVLEARAKHGENRLPQPEVRIVAMPTSINQPTSCDALHVPVERPLDR